MAHRPSSTIKVWGCALLLLGIWAVPLVAQLGHPKAAQAQTVTPVASATPTSAPTPTPAPSCGNVTYAAGWNLAGGPTNTTLKGAAGSLFTYQATDTGYESAPVSTALGGGIGVWAFFFSPTNVSLPCLRAQMFQVILPANHFVMVGNPGDTPAVLMGADAVETFNTLTNQYTTTAGTTTLNPGQGAWVVSQGGGALTIANR